MLADLVDCADVRMVQGRSRLGLTLEADRLRFMPLLPPEWSAFALHYRYRETSYHLQVLRTQFASDSASMTIDGVEQVDYVIRLVDDGKDHRVEVRVGRSMFETEQTILAAAG